MGKKFKLSDERGIAALEIYITLVIIIFFFILMLVSLMAIVQLGDTRADAQQVAEFVERRFRDDGCVTDKTRERAYELMDATGLGREGVRLTILDEEDDPVGNKRFRNNELAKLELEYPVRLLGAFNNLVAGNSASVNFPVYSQYVGTEGNEGCVSIP